MTIDTFNSTKTTTIYGRKDYAAAWHAARALIVKHNLFKLSHIEFNPNGMKTLYLCNLVRIDVSKSGQSKVFLFDLKTLQWFKAPYPKDFDIPLFPVSITRSLGWYTTMVVYAVKQACTASGLFDIMPPKPRVNKPAPLDVYFLLCKHFLGGNLRVASDEDRYQDTGFKTIARDSFLEGLQDDYKFKGALNHGQMTSAAKRLVGEFYEHFANKEVISAIVATGFKKRTLEEFLHFNNAHDDVVRIRKERPNLIPLLPFVPLKLMSKPDLFTAAYWVGKPSMGVMVGARNVGFNNGGFGHNSRVKHKTKMVDGFGFESAAIFKWVCKQPSSTVQQVTKMSSVNMIRSIVAVFADDKLPVLVTNAYLCRMAGYEYEGRLYQLYRQHCAKIHTAQGFLYLKQFLNGGAFYGGRQLIEDWLRGQTSIPLPKSATWETCVNAAQAWHAAEELRREQMAHEGSKAKRLRESKITWTSLVGETKVNDIVFTPLLSGAHLMDESLNLKHCVENYKYECESGTYKVFHCVEPDGAQSTLGLKLILPRSWYIEQHYGTRNKAVSPAAAAAGQEIAKLYNKVAHSEYLANKAKKTSGK